MGVTSTFVVPDDLDALTRHPKASQPGEPINLHHTQCHGCGDDAPEGLHIKIFAGDGFTVRARMLVEPRMEGGPGQIHGGILATAFDEVMSHLPLLVGGHCVTAHLQVDFAAGIPVGSTLYFEGRLLGRQRRKLYTEVVAYLADPLVDAGAEAVASGRALFVKIDSARHYAETLANSKAAEQISRRRG
ncbi:PaaI family thioesterase [Gordonia asplenii]|nr:PaaI family thioesterase [Gordonia asplenii]